MNIFSKNLFLRNSVILIALLSFVLFLIPINHSLVLDKGGVLTYSYAQQGGQNASTTPQSKKSIPDWLLSAPTSIVGFLFSGLIFLYSLVVGLFISLASGLLGIVMVINFELTQPSSNLAVAVGWNIFRVLANLGFVLGIVIIAIATILRIKSYSYQQILWKLIAAALLVNFSLVIAGGILEISDSLSFYFLEGISGKYYSRSNNLAENIRQGTVSISITDNQIIQTLMGDIVDFFTPGGLLQSDPPEENKITIWKIITSTLVGPRVVDLLTANINLVVLLIILATLLVLTGLIFVRYFYITALLIVSPIVWLMWVFPFGQRWWKEWWNHFLKWTFMLPLNLFFLWFAIKQMIGLRDATKALANTVGSQIFTGYTKFSQVIGSLIAVGFIVLGMKLSQSIGIKTAEGVVKGVENGAARLKEYSKIGVAKVYTRTGLASGVQKTLTDIGSTKLGRFIGVGKLAQRHQLASSRLEKKGLAGIDEKMKKYEEMGAGNVEKLLKTAVMPEEKQAMLAFLASKGRVGRDSEAFKRLGEAKMLQMAEELEKIGKKNEADEIRLALGKNKEIYEAEQAFKKEQTEENRKRLENAVRNFNQKYSKAEQQRKINKAVFSDANPTDEAAKLRQKLQAEFINSDISGGRFQGVNRELETTEQYVNLFGNMIGAQGVELSDPEVRGAFDAVFKERRPGSLQELRQTLIKKGADPLQVERITKQIKSTPLGIGLKAKGEGKKKEQEGGGGIIFDTEGGVQQGREQSRAQRLAEEMQYVEQLNRQRQQQQQGGMSFDKAGDSISFDTEGGPEFNPQQPTAE
jgi:MFS family permease